MKICFGTHNLNKLAEIQKLVGSDIEIVGLDDIGCTEDIPETGSTLEENALLKAGYVFDNYHVNCFADDTGLEVDALGGEPGVYSARYAGEPSDSNKNIDLVLDNLSDKTNRQARFKTVISLIIDGDVYYFEGVIEGEITHERTGTSGFGYDPIFLPEGSDLTFAEMSMEAKNKISHRGIAVRKLIRFLQDL